MKTENWTIEKQSVEQKRDFLIVRHTLRDGAAQQLNEYLLPLKQISMALVESTLAYKTFPFNVPHSHKIVESGEVTYDRPLSEWQAHAEQKGLLEDSSAQEKTCASCRSPFYDTSEQTLCYPCMKTAQQETLKQAEKLCRLAERYAQREDWQETADKIKNLQEQWRQLKHFPRDKNEALWLRFKDATQSFFDRRSMFFDARDRQRKANQDRAMQLIQQAKRCAEAADLREAREEIKRLQAAWKQVHPLPHERADDLWDEFRSHCQLVFER